MTRSKANRRAPNSPTGHRPPRPKKLAFAALTTAIFFLSLEGALALLGVRPIVDTHDPFVGFAANPPLFVESAGADTSADGSTWMATAPGKLAYFNQQRFLKQKPAGGFRIFCLGGSTTYGRPYDDATSFPAWLRELLPAAAPETSWEVINVGGVSYASYRVAALMEELVRRQPDLFVIYTGHNEFLEERTYRDLRQASPMRLRLTAALGKTRTFALLHGLAAAGRDSQPKRHQLPGEVDAILDHTVGPSSYHRDETLRRRVLDHFDINLTRMIQMARSAGAKVVLVAPAGNLKDCAPFKSQHREEMTAARRQQWSTLFNRGKSLEEAGQPKTALEFYQAALAIDDRYAELHYRKGRALLALDRLAEATAAFERALEEDVCPLRALPEIVASVRRIGRKFDVPVIDFPAILERNCLRNHGHNAPGQEYFLDHVHPTIAAHRTLALAIARRLAEEGIITKSASWTDAQIADVTAHIESRIDADAHAVALRNLAKVLNWAGKHEEAGRLALRALETLPDDPEALFLAAAYLKSTGETDQAIANYRQAIRQLPDYVEARQLLGAALVEREAFGEALTHFQHAARLRPGDAHVHQMIGAILSEMKQFEQALKAYGRAESVQPDDANLQYNMGFALANLGRRSQAIDRYRRAVALNSDDVDALFNLGILLQEQGQHSDAAKHLRQALRLAPDRVDVKEQLQQAEEEARSAPGPR